MDLQRIHIKILTDAPASLNLSPLVEIFSRWRTDKNHPAGWVDMADYAHVPRGPGIVLAGLRANFSFDMADPAPGILYVARRGLPGSPAERVAAALKAALELSKRLVAEKEVPPGVHLRTEAFELSFPDRLETPPTLATHQELRPAVEQALNRLFGAGAYELALTADSAESLRYSIRAHQAAPLDALLQRLR